MKKLKIGIDLDDTICDTASEIIKAATEYHTNILGRILNLKEVSQFKDYFHFAHMLEWDAEDIAKFFHYAYPDCLEKVKPLNSVVENVKKLQTLGCEFVIISSRKLSTKKDVLQLTKNWLLKNNFKIDEVNINEEDKSRIITDSNCNMFIDDSYKNCLKVLEEHPKVKVFLFSTRFNSDYVNDNLPKVSDWNDLYKKLVDLMEVKYE